MHNKLQYNSRGDYCECVRPTQLPVLTDVRTPSLLEQRARQAAHRHRAGYNTRSTKYKSSGALRFFPSYRCFGGSYWFHLQGSACEAVQSSSFLRSGGTCPHGVTCRAQAISNAHCFCPLAATELIYCTTVPLTAVPLTADSSPSHRYQQVACCRFHPTDVFRLATRNKGTGSSTW